MKKRLLHTLLGWALCLVCLCAVAPAAHATQKLTFTSDLVTISGALSYNGSRQYPTVTVKEGVNLGNYQISYKGELEGGGTTFGEGVWNAGTYTATITITGDGDYAPCENVSVGGTVTVSKAPLTPVLAKYDPGSKVYDGSDDANAVAYLNVEGMQGSDDIWNLIDLDSVTYTYDNENAGENKTITASNIKLREDPVAKNYYLTSETATTTGAITPKSITPALAERSGKDSAEKTYDGTINPDADEIWEVTASGFLEGDEVSLQYASLGYNSPNVSEASSFGASGIFLTGADAGNYALSTDALSVSGTIIKSAASITLSSSNRNITYDGSPIRVLEESELVLAGVAYDDLEFSWFISEGSDPDPTPLASAPVNVGAYTLRISVPDSANCYAAECEQSVVISKGTYPYQEELGKHDIQILNQGVRTGSVTLDALFGACVIPNGAALSEVVPPSSEEAMESVTIEGNTVAYTSLNNALGSEITDTYTVYVSSRNYVDFPIMLNFHTVDMLMVEIRGVAGAQNLVYNGQPQAGYTGTPTSEYSGPYSFLYRGSPYGGGDYLSDKAPADAGSYILCISVPETDPTYQGTIEVAFTIEPAGITLTANNKTAYVGDPIPELEYTASGLFGSDTLAQEPILAYEGDPDMSSPGTYSILISGASAPKTGNYLEEITYISGKLTIEELSTVAPMVPPADVGTTVGDDSSDNLQPAPKPNPQPELGESGGWDEIQEELASRAKDLKEGNLEPGATFTVEMNGATQVPEEVLAEIAGLDINVIFDMGGGVTWTVNGRDVPTGKADLNLGITTGGSSVPINVINTVAEEHSASQFELSHNGPFGTTLHLTMNMGETNRGLWGNLYYFDESIKELLFRHASRIDSDGEAGWPFDHASSYVVVIDQENQLPQWENPYEDVKEEDPFFAAVEYVSKYELLDGLTEDTFGPEEAVSRSAIAYGLYRQDGLPLVIGQNAFTDVDQKAVYRDAVIWADDNGILPALTQDSYGPEEALTREQLVQSLWQFAKFQEMDVSAGEDTNILSYSDAEMVTQAEAVQWACSQGILEADGDKLEPQREVTRGEAAQMLMRFLAVKEE